MTLTSPAWLLLLGLVPLLVILHAVAVRWRSTPVGSLVFWDEVMRERRTSLRIRRLLRSLTLVLQILAVSALSVALAGPRAVVPQGLAAQGDVVLVLDATASMQTREGTRTRFDAARERGMAAAAGLRRGARMAVIVAARSPVLLQGFTEDRAALRRALLSAQATDGPGDVAESIRLALSLRDPSRGGQVVLETDGAFESLDGVDLTQPWIRVEQSGSAQGNAGITALSFRRTPGSAARYELFMAVRNAGTTAVTVPLTVSAGRTAVVSRSLRLDPGERRALSIPWTGPDSGRIEAAIRSEDALPVDDHAYAVLAPARPLRVLVVGDATYFLQKALESLPGVTVRAEPGGGNAVQPLSPGASAPDADVVVYGAADPPALEKGNAIIFAAVPPNLPVRVRGTLELPPVTAWDRSSPLLDSVPLSGVTIGQSLDLAPGPGFTVLASSRGSPLILSWERSGLKALLVAFDPRQSDLPLRPGFPVLLANALSWFFPSWLSVQADQAGAGTVRTLSSRGAPQVSVVTPDGRTVTLSAPGSSVDFLGTARTGFYRVDAGGIASEFAVSTVSDSETDIAPRFSAGQGTQAGPASTAERGLGSLVWEILAAAALLLILLEWVAWLRVNPGAPR
jgi:hypothetical protein